MRGSRTVVIVPCYNEALTIARVVSDFKREYVRERYITHVPLAILATGFILAAMTFLSCAFILDTMVSHERQKNELAILRFEGKSLGVESDSEV